MNNTNTVVNLVGVFTVNGAEVKNLALKPTTENKIRFNSEAGMVAVIGLDTNGKMVKGIAPAEDALLQQLDHLGSTRAVKDQSIRMPA